MSSTAPRSVSARRAARHPKVAHLIAADEHALAELEALVATLPMCTTGRIFVEVPDASWIGVIDAPARMTVTWLDRSRRTGPAGSCRAAASGEALARAVNAWADEMLCDDDGETAVTLLAGFMATADIVDHLTEAVGHPAASIDAPVEYGLLAR